MDYYVISPNAWNDNNYLPYLEYMVKHGVVFMGWDKDSNWRGNMFCNMRSGDRVVVARGSNKNKECYFLGIVDDKTAKRDDVSGFNFTQYRCLRACKKIGRTDLPFNVANKYGASDSPGAIYRLDSSNPADKSVMEIVERFLVEEQEVFTTREIAHWRENGRVAIPALQRGLVWNPVQVELLWDSILRGFPIGSFVFSKACEDPSQKTESTAENAQYFLLDGQQRANAISLAYQEDDAGKKLSRLWIDLQPPCKIPGRKYSIKVTTTSHPWGFDNDENSSVLAAHEIRDAIMTFKCLSHLDVEDFDISELNLSDTWPVKAGCPIPMSIILKIFDSQHEGKDSFVQRVRDWVAKHTNLVNTILDERNITENLKDIYVALEGLSAYRIHANILTAKVIESEGNSYDLEQPSDLEMLFTRLNTMGSYISAYDLRYSAIKAYWGSVKEINERIAGRIMPGAMLAIFAIRLALTIAEMQKHSGEKDCVIKLQDIPTLRKIRKLGQGTELDEVESKARSILVDELYSKKLALLTIVDNVERALNVYSEDGRHGDMPPFIRTAIIDKSPDLYLLLMVLAYQGCLRDCDNIVAAATLYVHWMNDDTRNKKKDAVNNIFARLQSEGWSLSVFRKTLASMQGSELFALPSMTNANCFLGEDLSLSKNWTTLRKARFYSRIAWNRELLVFSERKYFNKHFKYDPAQTDFIKGHNKPWDYDHVIPSAWVYRKRGEYRGVCNYWLGTIGNLAAIPFSINRGKSCKSEWDEYLKNAEELLFDEYEKINIVRVTQKLLVKDRPTAELFCRMTSDRMLRIYNNWRSYVAEALDLREMDIEEDPVSNE